MAIAHPTSRGRRRIASRSVNSTNFGYTGDIVLPVQIDVPESAQDGGTAHIAVDAKWLVCQEECIPGKGSFALDMPVRSITANDTNVERFFTAARETTPQAAPWSGMAHVDGDRVDVTLHTTTLVRTRHRSTHSRSIAKSSPTRAPKITHHPNDITLTFKKSEYFAGTPAQFAFARAVRRHKRGTSPFRSMRPTHLRRNKRYRHETSRAFCRSCFRCFSRTLASPPRSASPRRISR